MADTGVPEVRVVYEPGRDGVTFDEVTTPMLKYLKDPKCGYGWTLYYMDEASEPAEIKTHFIGGDLDVNQVVIAAQESLRMAAPSGTA